MVLQLRCISTAPLTILINQSLRSQTSCANGQTYPSHQHKAPDHYHKATQPIMDLLLLLLNFATAEFAVAGCSGAAVASVNVLSSSSPYCCCCCHCCFYCYCCCCCLRAAVASAVALSSCYYCCCYMHPSSGYDEASITLFLHAQLLSSTVDVCCSSSFSYCYYCCCWTSCRGIIMVTRRQQPVVCSTDAVFTYR